MKQKKHVPVWLGILNLILVIVGVAWTVYSAFTAQPAGGERWISAAIQIITVVTLLATAVYCFVGYKKQPRVLGSAVLYIYTAMTFANSVLIRGAYAFLPVLSILSFGIMCVLAFGGEIGKKRSLVLCSVNAFLSVIRIVIYGLLAGQLPGGMFGNLVLSLILCLMILVKYADAEEA